MRPARRERIYFDREQFQADLEEASRLIRTNDMDGLVAFLARSSRERARAAALAARLHDKSPGYQTEPCD